MVVHFLILIICQILYLQTSITPRSGNLPKDTILSNAIPKQAVSPAILLKRKIDNYKKRKLKNDEEKRELNDKISNMKEVKQKWLEDD